MLRKSALLIQTHRSECRKMGVIVISDSVSHHVIEQNDLRRLLHGMSEWSGFADLGIGVHLLSLFGRYSYVYVLCLCACVRVAVWLNVYPIPAPCSDPDGTEGSRWTQGKEGETQSSLSMK